MTASLIERDVQDLLVAHGEWEAPLYLSRARIQVIEGVQATVQSALKRFRVVASMQGTSGFGFDVSGGSGSIWSGCPVLMNTRCRCNRD